jgi:ubiquinone/menaquinone biosynthesis C-methylase UbiE
VVQGDACHIPIRSGTFDTLLTAHVMHLVSDWRQALQEFRRALRPGGIYINVRTYEAAKESPRRRSREFWTSWLAGNGFRSSHPGVQDREELLDELIRMGAQVEEAEITRYTYQYTLREELERIHGRIYSDTWDVPAGIFPSSVKELASWMAEQFGDLDQEIEEEVSFNLESARFAG